MKYIKDYNDFINEAKLPDVNLNPLYLEAKESKRYKELIELEVKDISTLQQ